LGIATQTHTRHGAGTQNLKKFAFGEIHGSAIIEYAP
jgi:hypothetical protein